VAKLRAPVDPYCRTQGRGRLVKPDDADPNLAALTGYARGLGVQVWRYADDKLALTSKRYAKELGVEDAPLVFGGEGETLATTASKAFAALHEQSYTMQRTIRAAESVERQGRNARLDPMPAPQSPLDIMAKDAGGEIGDIVRTFNELPDVNDVARDLTGQKWFGGNSMIPVESALERLGDGAAVLAHMFRRRNEMIDRIRALVFTKYQEATTGLTSAELKGGAFRQYVERNELADEARRPLFEQAKVKVKAVNDWFYETKQAMDGEVAPRIQPSELVPTGEYFPHVRDMTSLKNPQAARALIEETKAAAFNSEAKLVLSDEQALEILEKQGFGAIREDRALRALQRSAGRYGKTLDRKDAERLLDTIIQRNTDRISPYLEREREFDFDGYITDADRAYTAVWTRNAHRIADLAVFGKKDERVYRLLDQMRYSPDMPSSAHAYAREVYDMEVGRNRKQPSSIVRELHNIEGAKLSMSVLYNLGQPLNTIIDVGMQPFLKAMGEAIRHPSRFASFRGGTLAERSGALPTQIFGSDATLRVVQETLGDVRENGMRAMLGDPREAYKPVARGLARGVDWIVNASLAAFRYVENFNRSISQRMGEIHFEQLAEQLRLKGEVGLKHRAIGQRIRELDLSPDRVLQAVRQGDSQALREMGILAGLRTSDKTQFKSNYQNMPLWANNSELGKFAFRFKNFALNQTKFMIREIGPASARKDPARWVRRVATITAAYPAMGIALTSIRQDLMGPTLAGDQIAEALQDPTVANLLWAGAVGMTMAGGLGIVADMGMTAAVGNEYVLARSFLPPTVSSFINAYMIAGSVGRAAASGDASELLVARSAALRQFGGVGAMLEERLRRREGRAEETPDLIEAVFGSSPFSS
jgi:hypothetical protein